MTRAVTLYNLLKHYQHQRHTKIATCRDASKTQKAAMLGFPDSNLVSEHLKNFIEHGLFTPEDKQFLQRPESRLSFMASAPARAILRGGLGAGIGAALGDDASTGALVGGLSGGIGSLALSGMSRAVENALTRKALNKIRREIFSNLFVAPKLNRGEMLDLLQSSPELRSWTKLLRAVGLHRHALRATPLNVFNTNDILRTPLALSLTSLPAIGLYNYLSD